MTWEFAEPDKSLAGAVPVRTKAQAVDCVLSRFPYTVNDKAYACSPNFIWQQPIPSHDFQNNQLGLKSN